MNELTPLDILGKTFAKRLHGYDPQGIHEFLSQVASTVEELMRNRGELRQQVRRLELDLASFRERENALQDALVAAQRSAEDTVKAARAEGQKIIDEAQTLGERFVAEANQRAQNIETVIGDLRGRRREVRAELMRLVELLQGMIRDDQQLEREEPPTPRLALLKRRKEASSE
jgi:cell division initiation protein